MTHLNPAEVILRYEVELNRRTELHHRMDDDYRLYRLTRFREGAANRGDSQFDSDEDEANNYAKYTSNDPRTFAKKVTAILSTAKIIAQVPAQDAHRDEREDQNAKERWVAGVLKAADDRLRRQKQASVQAQQSFFMPIRGHWAARVILRKNEDEETEVDITPWDPRHTMYKVGGRGLIWAINKSHRSREDILDTWGVEVESADNVDSKPDDMLEVYDYYDRDHNTVIVEEHVLKAPTEHGASHTPVSVGAIGPSPQLWHDEMDDLIRDWGESIYDQNRGIYPQNNLILSILMEHVKRSRKQPTMVTSPDGTKVLADDPWVEGSEISLAQGEKIEVLPALQAAAETGALAGIISGESQRGSLPHSAFGELQFQLSGFAINSLRQGMSTVLEPLTIGMRDFYLDVVEMLSDQYVKGSFKALEVSGRDRNRNFFSETITPEVVKKGGDCEIKVLAQLPQDDTTRFALAQQARLGPTPLLPDRFILDEVLQIQDADLIGDALKEQLAERASPLAAAWTLMTAAERQGRTEMARIYFGEALNILKQTLGQGAPGPQDRDGQTLTEVTQTFMPNNVAPSQAQGAPQPAPVPQQGPLVPPGTPRPGAQAGPVPSAEQIINSLTNNGRGNVG